MKNYIQRADEVKRRSEIFHGIFKNEVLLQLGLVRTSVRPYETVRCFRFRQVRNDRSISNFQGLSS